MFIILIALSRGQPQAEEALASSHHEGGGKNGRKSMQMA